MMEIKRLFDDGRTVVKAVYLNGKLIYTRTYIKDADGYTEQMITVFADGDYDIQ